MAQITEELELNDNFTWFVKTVNYDWKSSTVSIECIFQEGKFRHSRTFNYQAKHGMLEKDVIELLESENWYKLSTNQPQVRLFKKSGSITDSEVGFRSENKKSLWQRFLTFVKRLWRN